MNLCSQDSVQHSHKMAGVQCHSFFTALPSYFPSFLELHCNLHSFDGLKSQLSSTASNFKGFRSVTMYARIQSKSNGNIKSLSVVPMAE